VGGLALGYPSHGIYAQLFWSYASLRLFITVLLTPLEKKELQKRNRHAKPTVKLDRSVTDHNMKLTSVH
jgi:hypothetical protein